ncbi:MAG TPA: hypothetical protein VGB77_13435 [Abditibacteriaceae bacterium]|jgi:hypothetical protein
MHIAFMPKANNEGQIGRPLKFGEPMKRREFKLPESMGEKLTLEGQKRGRDVSDIVRDAIQAEFDGLVLKGLDDEERALLKVRAAEMGHSNPQHFLEDLARIAIGKPVEETRDFMIGDLLRRAQEVVTGKKKKAA